MMIHDGFSGNELMYSRTIGTHTRSHTHTLSHDGNADSIQYEREVKNIRIGVAA